MSSSSRGPASRFFHATFLQARLLLPWGCTLAGCADTLPDEISDYASRCVRMNRQLIRPRDDDPHQGRKNVYACGVSLEAQQNNTRPFADGTWIVKESVREDADYIWLIATAEKRSGTWHWNEYTRNFRDEEFLAILAPESTCIDCHRRVDSADWIFTQFELNSTVD